MSYIKCSLFKIIDFYIYQIELVIAFIIFLTLAERCMLWKYVMPEKVEIWTCVARCYFFVKVQYVERQKVEIWI
jgi:hypothetical protein